MLCLQGVPDVPRKSEEPQSSGPWQGGLNLGSPVPWCSQLRQWGHLSLTCVLLSGLGEFTRSHECRVPCPLWCHLPVVKLQQTPLSEPPTSSGCGNLLPGGFCHLET